MRAEDLKLEPCTECPVPMNVTIKPWTVNYYWDGTKWVIKNSDQQPDPQEELPTE